MKFTVFICLAILAAVSARLHADCDGHFANFMKKYFVRYGSDEQKLSRRGIFCENLKNADRLNELNGKDIFGVTKFSDQTPEEFSALLGRKNQAATPTTARSVRTPKTSGNLHAVDAPIVDWTKQGAVTPVKNQGQCGSCWAHSAVEQIESEWILAGNSMWEFSVQQVTSCVRNTLGCGGGDTPAAYEYLMALPAGEGLGSGAWAPYVQSMTERCLGKRCTEACADLDIDILNTEAKLTGPLTAVTGYDYATTPCSSGACSSQNVTLLAQNIATHGPASICVNAANWNSYVGGVMTETACGGMAASDIDHCVQLTGYNSEANPPYWIVRNSWATDWGVNGYIYLAFGENTCGLANEATFVTLGNSAYAGK